MSHGNVPKPIQNLYKSNNNVHTHFTRHAHHFHTMRGNNELIYRTCAFQSILIWNKLLQNINIHVSYTRFKHPTISISTYYVPYPSTSLPILVIKNDFRLSIFLYKLYY